MKRGLLTLLTIAVVALLFVIILHSIVRIKLYDLNAKIKREQIQNYELSSRMLEARFRSYLYGGDAFKEEVRISVLESSIMNGAEGEMASQIGISEKIGMGVVNTVRFLYLQPLLEVSEDQESLILLQYAFLMERNRKYAVASEKYTEIEDRLRKKKNNDYGFVLLHNGYCLALIGKTAESIVRLRRVMEQFPGSHYAETAKLLLDILTEREDDKRKIETKYSNVVDQADELFRSGQYALALEKYGEDKNLNIPHRLYRARSLEETGRIDEAVRGYIELVEQQQNRTVAKEANRRLLLIGNFYGGGDRLANFAEEKANVMGDTQAAKQVETASELQMQPVVVERLEGLTAEEAKSAGLSEIKETLLTELREEAVAEKVEKFIEVRSEESLNEEKRIEEERRRKERARLDIHLIDGRVIAGRSIESGEAGSVTIFLGDFSITIPVTMIERIESEGFKIVVERRGKRPFTGNSIRVSEESLFIMDENREEAIPIRGGFKIHL
jgi:tetratricopeptide (TPR) repeat protein